MHVRGKAIVLETMRRQEEIRSADFEPPEFEDEYARAVEELVAKRAVGRDVTDVAEI